MKKLHQHLSEKKTSDELPWIEKWFIRDSFLRSGFIFLLFVGLGFMIYSNTLDSPFVFDDEIRILENYDIRLEHLSADNLLKAAFGKKSAHARPVGNISFALNYYFHQYQLAGYHILNIIIHIVTGILLWLIIRKTLNLNSVRPAIENGQWIALIAALLWLVNPVQTQSITYIVQRFTSMAAMFFLLSFLFYLNGRLTVKKGPRWTWFTSAALAWFLALGCRENTAMLPFSHIPL